MKRFLTHVQSRSVRDGASIAPAVADYPREHIDWHEGHGFVLECYEREESWSDLLVTTRHVSPPSIEVELGGQALERKQDPALEWVRIDAFPEETLWEGRAEREAWECANPRKG